MATPYRLWISYGFLDIAPCALGAIPSLRVTGGRVAIAVAKSGGCCGLVVPDLRFRMLVRLMDFLWISRYSPLKPQREP